MNLRARTEALLGAAVTGGGPLSGGDLSQIARFTLDDYREVVAKTGPDPRAEADMLRAMGDAGAPVPQVLAAADVLILEYIQDDGQASWSDLGAVLTRLHSTTGPYYGWPQNYAFGTVEIDNSPSETWPEFWAERRLLCHLPHIDAGLAKRLETLAKDLLNRLPATPPASLLHGDCWGGNILFAKGKVSALIDPACSYGDAEVDLAMLHLFARPGADFAYETRPGAEARRPIYTLWPALVHLRLFGGGYRPMVERLLTRCGV
ncbi:fructosamine kinase family protein [Paracoccaceae bacterium GXU_MW_L88]